MLPYLGRDRKLAFIGRGTKNGFGNPTTGREP